MNSHIALYSITITSGWSKLNIVDKLCKEKMKTTLSYYYEIMFIYCVLNNTIISVLRLNSLMYKYFVVVSSTEIMNFL